MHGTIREPYTIKQNVKMNYTNINESISNVITEAALEQSCQEFDSIIQRLRNYRKIYIYGAGGWGSSLQELLELYSIETHAFFDQKTDEIGMINNIPICNPDHYETTESSKEESLVIIAIRLEHQESIANRLKEKGYINYTTINGIWHYGCWSDRKELFSLIDEKEEILACSELWADQKSIDIYLEQIECYLSRKYNVSNRIDNDQYFPEDIIFRKGYSRFVDCGAYTGDTISSLTEKRGRIDNLVAIEPDTGNFKELSSYIERKRDNIAEDIQLYPFGVWSSSKTLLFVNNQGSGCHLSETGNTPLQCIALDDILIEFTPTFIKMDVEGAEVEAIKGASHTIGNCKPDLAISVYHMIEHLWKIPLLLKSIDDKYKFYLRSYEHFNQETVLYAV